MKKILFNAILLISCFHSYCQTIDQDANGKSSIIVPGSAFSFDVNGTKTLLNYYGSPGHNNDPNKFLFGGEIQNQNKAGDSLLFTKGVFTPQTSLSGVFGRVHSWTNGSSEYNYLLIYLRAEGSSLNFTYDKGSIYKSEIQRFTDTSHFGWRYELGGNFGYNSKHYFGLSFGREYQSDFSLLKKESFDYTEIDSSFTSGTLKIKKTITSYSGKYYEGWVSYFNFDYVYLIPIKTDTSYFCPSIFLRNTMPDSKSNIKGYTIVGIGGYFVNGKTGALMGGVYLQSNDVSARTEVHFLKTISFGVVGKIAIDSGGKL